MAIKEVYDAIGSNYYEVLDRFLRDELVEEFALRFLEDKTYKELEKAVSENDIETSFRAAHTLKGVAGNLGFSNLYRAASDLTEQLRPGRMPADPVLFQKVKEKYMDVIGVLTIYDPGR